MKTRALVSLWIAYMLAIVAGGVFAFASGFKINTDFLSIFPKHEEVDDFHKVNATYEKHFENEILVFVASENVDLAVAEAKQLAERMRKSGLFTVAQVEFAGDQHNAWVPFLYSKRQLLMTDEQVALIQGGKAQTLVDKAVQNLYSPVGLTSQVGTDPLGLFQDFFLKTSSAFKLRPYQGHLVAEKEGRSAIFIRAQIDRNALSFNEDLIKFYETEKASASEAGVEVSFLGASLFSAFGSEKAMDEISLYGTLSFLAVLILLVWCFSSVVPVIVSLLTIAISVGAGLVVTSIVYSSVHVMSILLGISVLGIVTDYCTHFFAKGFDRKLHSSDEVMKKIKGALGVGFLTNVFTYICFYFTDLIVLKQLAVFTITGIFTTYLSVMALFPYLRFRRLKTGRLGKVAEWSLLFDKFGIGKSLAALAAIVVAGLVYKGGVRFDDDVRLLQSVPKVLKQDEEKVLGYLGTQRAMSYFVVKGDSADLLLENEETLAAQLRAKALHAVSLSNFVPSLKRQMASYNAYYSLGPAFETFYKTIGTDGRKKTENLLITKPEFFTVGRLLNSSVEFPLKMNWLGEVESGKFYSIVSVVGDANYGELKSLETSSAKLVSKANDISQFIELLRKTITQQFAYVLGLLAMLFVFLWKWKRALFVLLPPVIASVVTLVLVSVYAGYLNLFNVLAVIMIFCLGLDYSVFYSQSKGSTEATHVGILISFLSTIGSFGVLALSSTYAVSSFGATVFIGITLCYLLAPLAVRGDHG